MQYIPSEKPNQILFRKSKEYNGVEFNTVMCKKSKKEDSVVAMLDTLDETKPMYFTYRPNKDTEEYLIVDPTNWTYYCTPSQTLTHILKIISYLYDRKIIKDRKLLMRLTREGLHG